MKTVAVWPVSAIEPNDVAVPAEGINVIGIQRIGSDETAFKGAAGKPFAIGDQAEVRAIGNDDRSGILLRGVEPVRKRIVRGDAIELAGRLIEPSAPGLAAVVGDDGALIGAFQDVVRILRIDPEDVIVFAAGSSLPGGERAAAIRRSDTWKSASRKRHPDFSDRKRRGQNSRSRECVGRW